MLIIVDVYGLGCRVLQKVTLSTRNSRFVHDFRDEVLFCTCVLRYYGYAFLLKQTSCFYSQRDDTIDLVIIR